MPTESELRKHSCCFSGHRDIPPNIAAQLFERLKNGVDYLYAQGITTFYAGGALGFDTLAAEAVIQRRKQHPDIRLIIVIPCRDQSKLWNMGDVQRYERIKASADGVVCLSEHYSQGCMHRRNRYMEDNSCACVCYLAKQTGGTAYTVKYAKENGLRVFNLARKKRE